MPKLLKVRQALTKKVLRVLQKVLRVLNVLEVFIRC